MVVAALASSQIVSAQVPAGGAFRVNSYTTSRQARPAVARDKDRDFIVVWDSSGGSPQVFVTSGNAPILEEPIPIPALVMTEVLEQPLLVSAREYVDKDPGNR